MSGSCRRLPDKFSSTMGKVINHGTNLQSRCMHLYRIEYFKFCYITWLIYVNSMGVIVCSLAECTLILSEKRKTSLTSPYHLHLCAY
jgi:hypothetical protein